ncbi:hypothetical protein EAH79_02040 [Sphingomonas koreensis]|nr:hypothetical protein EAH79_02040 [Sphingomonas koreensis]
MLTTFERVKAILDQLCPPLDVPVGQAHTRLKAQLLALGSEYPRIYDGSRKSVDYSDPACHAAYVFKYLTANASLIYRALIDAEAAKYQIFAKQSITMVCVGGGPATELAALFKYLERVTNGVAHVRCVILDHYPAWTTVYEALLATKPASIEVEIQHVAMQLTDPTTVPLERIAEADLLTFSYSLSEAWRYNAATGDAVNRSVQAIVGAVPPGALIIYADNAGPHFDPNMEREFVGRFDLSQIDRTDHTHMLVDSDEQMDTVKGYKDWLDMRPKLTGKATTAVFVKL